MGFVWDEIKNLKNFKKHNVWFEEAVTVFLDKKALEIYDVWHSKMSEDRYVLMGISTGLRLLVVIYAEMYHEETIRIISARKACRAEVKEYEKKI